MPEDDVLKTEETSAPTEASQGQTEEASKQETSVDSRYAGKSVAELARMLDEKESFIGRQATEIGKVRELAEQVNYLRGALESRQYQPQEAPTPVVPPKAEFDFTNPEGYVNDAINRAVDQKLTAFQREMQRRDAESYARTARYNFERGQKQAMSSEPELFKGIEGDVQSALAQQVKSGQIAPELLGDPMTWTTAAAMIRFLRGERDKIAPAKRQGMTPVDLGSPTKARAVADDDDVTLTDEDRRWARDNGLDEKTLVDGFRRGRALAYQGKLR